MSSISNLLKLWAVRRFLTSRTSMLQKLLTRLAAITCIGIIISVLIGASLAGGLGFGYNEMLLHGIDRYAALSIIAAVTVALLALLALVAWRSWHKFRKLTRRFLMHESPIAMRLEEVADAFFEGLMGEERP